METPPLSNLLTVYGHQSASQWSLSWGEQTGNILSPLSPHTWPRTSTPLPLNRPF